MNRTDFPIAGSFLTALIDVATTLAAAEGDIARESSIGTGGLPLATRLIVKRDKDSCIYLHRWRNSDPDDFHDHPWDSVSLVLYGGLWEVTPEGRFWRPPGSVVFRKAEDRHRIEIERPGRGIEYPVTLFITGPERREWGFHTSGGFVIGRIYRSLEEHAKRHGKTGG